MKVKRRSYYFFLRTGRSNNPGKELYEKIKCNSFNDIISPAVEEIKSVRGDNFSLDCALMSCSVQ